MFDEAQTFVGACLARQAFAEDVDDWVQAWHDSGGAPTGNPVSLDSFLGFTCEEGDLWAERPEALRFVLAAHRYECSVGDLLASQDDYALTARAASPHSAAGVLAWLRETGRLR